MKDILNQKRQKIRSYCNLSFIVFIVLFLSACANKQSEKRVPQQPPQEVFKPDLNKAAKINSELGIVYVNRGMLDLAKRKILKAKSQNDNIAIVHYAMGLYLAKIGDTKGANQSFLQALTIDPTNSQAMTFYAQFLCEIGKYPEARSWFKKSLNLINNVNRGQTYEAYAVCNLNTGNQKQAKILFEKSLQQNPNIILPYLELAKILYVEKKYYKAKNMLAYYHSFHNQTKESLELELKIALALNEGDRAASLRLQVESNY